MEAEGENYKEPPKMKRPLKKKDLKLYCRFHKDIGHDTEDCLDLKCEIEFLIQRKRLGRFVKNALDENQASKWRKLWKGDIQRNNPRDDNHRNDKGIDRNQDAERGD